MKDYTVSTVEYYNNNHQQYFNRTHDVDMTSAYNKFLELLPTHAHILDAGCGVGRDSEFFIKSGYEVTALDASIEMVKYAQQKVPVVLHQTFESMTFKEEFDGIWTCASLLHISYDDLPDIFNRFIAALKPNGIWYISFKYGDKQTVENGRLFSRFTINNFGDFIEQFKTLKVMDLWQSHSDIHNIQNDWLQAIVKKYR